MIKSAFSALLIFVPLLSFASKGQRGPVVVGSKGFSESIILAEMAALLLEEEGLKVIRKTNLGGTSVVFDALKSGDIDLYPEYTGTGYVMVLKRSGESDPQKVYDAVKYEFSERFGLEWSGPIGFNNTYALAVRASDERFKNVQNISQLKGLVSDKVFAAPHEFMEREDGFGPFKKRYELDFKDGNTKALNSGLMYSAIRDGQVDIIMSYSTDGRIKAYDLKLLKDDLHFFPPYFAAFLSNEKSMREFPEIGIITSQVEGLITEKEMIALNDQVDRGKREPSLVAKNFLVQKGLIEGEIRSGEQKRRGFFTYAFSKRHYLNKLVWEHLALSFGALSLALMVSVPLGIALTRRPMLAKAVFPVVNTVQTVPSLALLGFLIPIIGIGYTPAVIALFLYSLLPLIRNTYTGIDAVDKDMIEAAKGIGLTDSQVLRKVEIPLALPVILAGVRTASVIVIGTATLAALVGAGGLGDPIFRGVATVNSDLILLGAVPSALLAIIVDRGLGLLETKVVSKGLRL